MKRLFLSLAILVGLSFSVSVNAQDAKRGNKRGFALPQELNLTNDQQQKVESVNTDFKAKMTELKGKSDLSKEDKRAKMRELRKEHRDAINNILTPEQQAKLKELQSQKEKEMSMRHKKHSKQMNKRGDYMKDLNLTDKQKQDIKALNEEYKLKTKELTKKHQETLSSIYTPEQQAKLKDMRKDYTKRRFANSERRAKLDDTSMAKLKSLKENYSKEKKAIELSRIAPDAQKQKLSDLRDNFRKEKRQIINEARKANSIRENKPA